MLAVPLFWSFEPREKGIKTKIRWSLRAAGLATRTSEPVGASDDTPKFTACAKCSGVSFGSQENWKGTGGRVGCWDFPGKMCCFQRSSRGVGAASPGCSTQNFVAHKITQNLVAHKTLNDASHGPCHLFPVLYPVPLWQLILEDSSGQPVLHEIRKKKSRIPFCLPNSCWNWFNCSRGLKSFHENLTTHVEVSACTVSLLAPLEHGTVCKG